jgi:hypothetical protein
MEINKVGRNKIKVNDGERSVAIEVNRVGRQLLVSVTADGNTTDLTLKHVQSEKFIRLLRKLGVSDVSRVVSYITNMSNIKTIEAPRAVFMNVEDVVDVSTGAAVSQLVETYYHTADGWRLFTSASNEVRDVYNITAKIKNIDKLFWHYNSQDVNIDDLYTLSDTVKELKDVLKQYVVLEEKYYDIVAAWAALSYMRWAAPYSELLIIRKPGFGHGGSTLLKTVRLLAARPLKLVVNTSPAAFYRIVDFTMPTIALDEIREDEADNEKLAELKLLAEAAFDEENVVLRVEEGEVEVFSTFANVAVVDSTDKFTTYSSERRAWTAVVRAATPARLYDRYEILKATEGLRERLYSIGIVLPTSFYPKWRQLSAEQGLGALKAVIEVLKQTGQDTSIFQSALDAVAAQLEYARQTAALGDSKRTVANIIAKIIEDARMELETAANSSNPADMLTIVTPADQEYRCGVIYLEKLMREVRRRAIEIDKIVTSKLDNVYYTTTEHRYWFRVANDLEMYMKPAKIKAILAELGVNIELDESRHYAVRVCRA